MKQDFDAMSIKELRAYVLTHRDDNEAFYKLADRLETTSEFTDVYPAPDTPEAIALMKTAIRNHIQQLEDKRKE
ncbi:MAG: hypothetical protein AAFW75_13615 [Cyanobacteria bacterium J06636_16]